MMQMIKQESALAGEIIEFNQPCEANVHLEIDQAIFRQGMSNLGAAVNVITTKGDAGQAGFTASAVCSVTDSPPTLLVCLNRAASVYTIFSENKVLCVNTLGSNQAELSNLFGGKTPMQQRFAQAEWSELVTGSPVLDNALISFDCEVVSSQVVGSHDVLFCQVKAIRHNPSLNALLYFKRSYCEPQNVC
ncbi:NADH-dependent FMN reductase RutF [Acinetobacter guillouiae]|uniref:NADH-dependent FMN reductase RutF n=1 Tax=Acinetobacter guillouiae TaxID=106649 RepID=UPI0012506E21